MPWRQSALILKLSEFFFFFFYRNNLPRPSSDSLAPRSKAGVESIRNKFYFRSLNVPRRLTSLQSLGYVSHRDVRELIFES